MALSEQDKQEIGDLIKATVNGKIDNLAAQMNALTNDEGTGSLDPMVKVVNGAVHIRSQLFIIITGMLAFGGAIQSAQALWGFISPHIKP